MEKFSKNSPAYGILNHHSAASDIVIAKRLEVTEHPQRILPIILKLPLCLYLRIISDVDTVVVPGEFTVCPKLGAPEDAVRLLLVCGDLITPLY